MIKRGPMADQIRTSAERAAKAAPLFGSGKSTTEVARVLGCTYGQSRAARILLGMDRPQPVVAPLASWANDAEMDSDCWAQRIADDRAPWIHATDSDLARAQSSMRRLRTLISRAINILMREGERVDR